MIEGVLIFVIAVSYGSIIKVVSDGKYYSSKYNYSGTYLYWFLVGWFVFPFWVIYKFWKWFLTEMPSQIKEWRRERRCSK